MSKPNLDEILSKSPIKAFDRDGNEITFNRWQELQQDPTYIHVAVDRIVKEGKKWVISTVWRGLGPSDGSDSGIFQTAVFIKDSDEDARLVKHWDYSTLQDAEESHEVVVSAFEAATGCKCVGKEEK